MARNAMMAALLAAWLTDHKAAADAVKSAIDRTLKDGKLQDAAKQEHNSTWQAWLGAGQQLANAGADSELAVTVIDALSGDDKLTQSSVATYKSRVSSVVPILALDDEAYAELWNKTNITERQDGEDVAVEPNRVFNNQIAAKLIKTFRDAPITAKDRLKAALKAISDSIRASANPKLPEDMPEKEKTIQRQNAMANALRQADDVIELLGLDVTLPAVSVLLNGSAIYGAQPAPVIGETEGDEMPNVDQAGEGHERKVA